MIERSIQLDVGVTLMTAGKTPGDSTCAATAIHDCAELRAGASLYNPDGSGIIHVSADNAALEQIVINGDRSNRISSAAGVGEPNNGGLGYNMRVGGTGVVIRGIVTKNALGASGMRVDVGTTGLTVVRSIVAYNGAHPGGSSDGLFSDGITAWNSANSTFTDNVFIDNTDVDLIFEHCPNCVIQGNLIQHSDDATRSSFGGLMFTGGAQPSPLDGNFTGADVSGNLIDCGLRKCGVGLMLGEGPWLASGAAAIPFFGGSFHDNHVRGAMEGLDVNPTAAIQLFNNTVVDSGGIFAGGSCGTASYPAMNIEPSSAPNVNRSEDSIPNANYANQNLAGCTPNWTPPADSALPANQTAPIVNLNVTGNIDGVVLDGAGNYQILGWACAGNFTASIPVQIYLSAPFGSPGANLIGEAIADLPSEPAVAAACGARNGSFRFSYSISAAEIAADGGQSIYVYGISPFDADGNALLGHSGSFSMPTGPGSAPATNANPISSPLLNSTPALAPAPIPAAAPAPNPVPAAIATPATLPIYQFYFASSGDYLFSASSTEGTSAGYSGQGIGFYLFAGAAANFLPLYRCNDSGDHFLSLSSNCEGQSVDAALGYVSVAASDWAPSTLYRCVSPSTGHHFESRSQSACASQGATVEGILGYVP